MCRSILAPVSVLPATATYPTPGSRFAHYTPDDGPGVTGTLEIVYRAADGSELKAADTYKVIEDTSAPFPLRRFRVGAYKVTVSPGRGRELGYTCDCQARASCKHGDSILNLLVKGEFDAVIPSEYPQFVGYTDDELADMAQAYTMG